MITTKKQKKGHILRLNAQKNQQMKTCVETSKVGFEDLSRHETKKRETPNWTKVLKPLLRAAAAVAWCVLS